MDKNYKIVLIILAIILLAAVIYVIEVEEAGEAQNGSEQTGQETKSATEINNFEECAAAGYEVTELYPRKCSVDDGKMFLELVGNKNVKSDKIRVENINDGDYISSPLEIEGEARGYWFNEASFLIRFYDENGNLLGEAIASATGDWMTDDFVAFKATLEFDSSQSSDGLLVFEKDNPSDILENDDSMQMVVRMNVFTEADD